MSSSPAWQLSGVTFRYSGARAPAVDAVTLAVQAGAFTALIGPNGAGKSTLLRLLLGTASPDAGSVTFRDKPVHAWARRDLARQIGVVPQGEVEPLFSVREVVAMGRYPHLGPWEAERPTDVAAIDRAIERCDLVGMGDRLLPTLSGGEQQRARVARALAQEPSVLALDEPTAHLDLRHEMTTFALLRELREAETTIVLATHNLNLAARYADRVVLMRQGRVVAEGTPSEVFTAQTVSAAYDWRVAIVPHADGAPQIVPLDMTD